MHLQIEEQPKWNAGVKMSQVVGRVNQTTTHVKQVCMEKLAAHRCVPCNSFQGLVSMSARSSNA
jgi:hypothetical protein